MNKCSEKVNIKMKASKKRKATSNTQRKYDKLPIKDLIPNIKFVAPITDTQIKEVKLRFGNLHYRSVIGALLYVSCCTRPDIVFAVNKLVKFSNKPGITHYQAILHLIGYIKHMAHMQLNFFSIYKESPIFKNLMNNNIEIDEEIIVTVTDSSWNDYFDRGRCTGGNCTIVQSGPVDHSSHLPIPVAMSSGEAEYIAAATACMRTSHLLMGTSFL